MYLKHILVYLFLTRVHIFHQSQGCHNIHNACSDLKVQPSVMSVNTETVIDKNNDFALTYSAHTP